MVNEAANFGISVLGTIVGLAILLFGVSQNAGQSLNTPMIAGGVIVLAAMGVLTAWLFRLEGGHHATE